MWEEASTLVGTRKKTFGGSDPDGSMEPEKAVAIGQRSIRGWRWNVSALWSSCSASSSFSSRYSRCVLHAVLLSCDSISSRVQHSTKPKPTYFLASSLSIAKWSAGMRDRIRWKQENLFFPELFYFEILIIIDFVMLFSCKTFHWVSSWLRLFLLDLSFVIKIELNWSKLIKHAFGNAL